MIRRILCATDFSPASDPAVHAALALARQVGADVHFVHVWRLLPYALPEGPSFPDGSAPSSRESSDEMERTLAAHRDRDVLTRGHVVEGEPAAEIVRMARELEVDVIVMGTHGRRGLARVCLGSVAERVVRAADVAVLTVPGGKKRSASAA